MDSLDAIVQARALLAEITPLRRDCGQICGAACCAPDEDGQGGMLLFPGEEALYPTLPDGVSLRRDDSIMPGLTLFTCSGACRRCERPLACRMFPLTPVLSLQDNREVLRIRMDPRAFSVCPLCEGGVRGLDPRFVQAIRDSARILCRCKEHRAYFRSLGAYFQRLRAW